MKKFFADKLIIFPLILLIIIIIVFDNYCPVVFLRNHYTKTLGQTTKVCKYVIKTSPKRTIKGNYIGYVAQMIAHKNQTQWIKTTGDVQIYLPVKDREGKYYPSLRMGDTITAKSNLIPISNFDSSFDYVKYMKHKRIYHSAFIKDFDINKRKAAKNIRLLAFDINTKLKNILQQSNMSKRQASLAIAMLLGDKSTMQEDTRQMFNHSGLAHIICVSGLHVIIIVSFFDFLLGFVISSNLRGFYLRRIILMLLTWCIAFVVGLTPSCVRVAVMCSLVLLGEISKRDYNNCNILLTTAFIFLLFDPLLLFNISFQLSFLAVFGIFLFKPYIFSKLTYLSALCFQPANRIKFISDKILQNVSISIATQICCLPVLIINFGYFPLFFFLANIVAIPLAQIILISIIVYLPLSFLPVIPSLLSEVLNLEISLLLFITEQTEKLNSLFL